jgi:hypothetical protein
VEERPFRAAFRAVLMKGFSPGVRASPTAMEERPPALKGTGGPGFDLADPTTSVGAPFFAHFAKGGNSGRRERVVFLHSSYSIAKRNLGPAHIHSHRAGLVEKIETIAAPSPQLRRFHQSA